MSMTASQGTGPREGVFRPQLSLPGSAAMQLSRPLVPAYASQPQRHSNTSPPSGHAHPSTLSGNFQPPRSGPFPVSYNAASAFLSAPSGPFSSLLPPSQHMGRVSLPSSSSSSPPFLSAPSSSSSRAPRSLDESCYSGSGGVANAGVWSTDLRAAYRSWLQTHRGISKETAITYSHAVHGVLKELVMKRVQEQLPGPRVHMDAAQLSGLIVEQHREAERIVKRDKRSSYFRYLKEFLELPLDESLDMVSAPAPPASSPPPGLSMSVWSGALRSSFQQWLESPPHESNDGLGGGLGLSSMEASEYCKACHSLLKKVVTLHGAGSQWTLLDKEALTSLLKARPSFVSRVVRGSRSKHAFRALQEFLGLVGPGTATTLLMHQQQQQGMHSGHDSGSDSGSMAVSAVSPWPPVWSEGVRSGFRRWLQDSKGLAESSTRAHCQHLQTTLRDLLRRRQVCESSVDESGGLGYREIRQLLGCGYDERTEAQACFRYLREYMAMPRTATQHYLHPPSPPQQHQHQQQQQPQPPSPPMSSINTQPRCSVVSSCVPCAELRLDLQEREVECQHWRNRCEALGHEVRALQRMVQSFKRGHSPPLDRPRPSPLWDHSNTHPPMAAPKQDSSPPSHCLPPPLMQREVSRPLFRPRDEHDTHPHNTVGESSVSRPPKKSRLLSSVPLPPPVHGAGQASGPLSEDSDDPAVALLSLGQCSKMASLLTAACSALTHDNGPRPTPPTSQPHDSRMAGTSTTDKTSNSNSALLVR